MNITQRVFQIENDYWRIRNFPREVFLLNDRLEHSWSVARLDYWRRGLGKTVVLEELRRLQQLGCTRVFSTANEAPADALYRSVMTDMKVTDTWVKEFIQEQP